MKNRGIIDYNVQIIIREKSKYRAASQTEVMLLEDAKKAILDENGWNKVPFLKIKGFYNLLNAKLKLLYDWDMLYKQCLIVCDQVQLDNYAGITDEMIQMSQKQLNDFVINAINDQADGFYTKNQLDYDNLVKQFIEGDFEEFTDVVKQNEKCFFRIPDDYIEVQENLANLFLKI